MGYLAYGKKERGLGHERRKEYDQTTEELNVSSDRKVNIEGFYFVM